MKKIYVLVVVMLVCVFNLTFSMNNSVIENGKASYYANKFQGRKTANGEIFNNRELTAAHKKLPMGTLVRVTNLENGKSIDVRINDRGPFVKGRVIDLTQKAFDEIGDRKLGVVNVKVEVL